jgi:hypothetical protein
MEEVVEQLRRREQALKAVGRFQALVVVEGKKEKALESAANSGEVCFAENAVEKKASRWGRSLDSERRRERCSTTKFTASGHGIFLSQQFEARSTRSSRHGWAGNVGMQVREHVVEAHKSAGLCMCTDGHRGLICRKDKASLAHRSVG